MRPPDTILIAIKQRHVVTKTLSIRPIKEADRTAWDTLWTDYLTFYETSLPKEVYDISFARLLNPSDTEFKGLIAELNGEPIGLVHFLYHRHMWKLENTCYLQDLYVSETARGTGAGRALIQAVYDDADKANCPSVYWLTQDFNQTARLLYDRIGTKTPFIRYSRPT